MYRCINGDGHVGGHGAVAAAPRVTLTQVTGEVRAQSELAASVRNASVMIARACGRRGRGRDREPP